METRVKNGLEKRPVWPTTVVSTEWTLSRNSDATPLCADYWRAGCAHIHGLIQSTFLTSYKEGAPLYFPLFCPNIDNIPPSAPLHGKLARCTPEKYLTSNPMDFLVLNILTGCWIEEGNRVPCCFDIEYFSRVSALLSITIWRLRNRTKVWENTDRRLGIGMVNISKT